MHIEPAIVRGVIAPAAVALGALLFVPQFVSILSHFANLPWLSRAVLATYQWWVLVPLVIAALLVVTGWHRTHSRTIAAAGATVAACFFACAVFGVYAPMFLLAYSVAG